ncbi:ribosomal protein L31, mitochondrial [Rhodotorula toruloides]|uniref:Ribosomal protein L31, mitochondrial n=1 Tax=Rhodotorula toruloides TaxID=5286 RepID=A0A511KGH0_RHOTO|nr:ribosomal protein L31, mitochondrial [Rhodotorula toruloides]
MFGAFRPSQTTLGGLLWKIPYRMSPTRKTRQRLRLKAVDDVIAAVNASGVQTLSLTRCLELPTEQEMPARDKYTVFSRYGRNYRKGIHKVPHFTKVTSRVNPKGF